jgi:hypothetical protein
MLEAMIVWTYMFTFMGHRTEMIYSHKATDAHSKAISPRSDCTKACSATAVTSCELKPVKPGIVAAFIKFASGSPPLEACKGVANRGGRHESRELRFEAS